MIYACYLTTHQRWVHWVVYLSYIHWADDGTYLLRIDGASDTGFQIAVDCRVRIVQYLLTFCCLTDTTNFRLQWSAVMTFRSLLPAQAGKPTQLSSTPGWPAMVGDVVSADIVMVTFFDFWVGTYWYLEGEKWWWWTCMEWCGKDLWKRRFNTNLGYRLM